MINVIPFVPNKRENPKLTAVSSAWGNIPTIIDDILNRFNLKRNIALEFGVEYGYSTSALANYFTNVVGVDTFEGDPHSGYKTNHLEITSKNLSDFNNIKLIKSDYKEFIKSDTNYYDMIHVDIVHTFQDTYDCGKWSVEHSDCVIFHDTLSFRDVFLAVNQLSIDCNLDFYNYQESHGLGILIRKQV